MTCDNGRYLTPEGKAAVLAEWGATLAALHGQTGPGVPDPAIVPWCTRLNAMEGVCTLQSCAGHVERDGTRTAGHLWLWLDMRRSQEWNRRAHELAATPGVERVARLYSPWGQEVHEVWFEGEERGRLTSSLAAITSFVARL